MTMRIFLVILMACNACLGTKGNGQAAQQTRSVVPVHALVVQGALTVLVDAQAKTPRTLVRGDENLLDKIDTSIVDGVLTVSTNGQLTPVVPLVLELATPALDAVTLQGAAAVTLAGLHGNQFDLHVDGAADVHGKGSVDKLQLTLSGIAAVDAENLLAHDVAVDVSGASRCVVHPLQALDVKISGTGTVEYIGREVKITKNIAGIGVLRPKD